LSGSYSFDFQGQIYPIPSNFMQNLCLQNTHISAEQEMDFAAILPGTNMYLQEWIKEPRHWLMLSLEPTSTHEIIP